MPSMTLMMSAILLARLVDAFHGVHHLAHHLAALRGHGGGALGQLVGLAGVVGVLLDGEPSSSIEAAVSSSALAWLSVRLLRSWLPWAISALAVVVALTLSQPACARRLRQSVAATKSSHNNLAQKCFEPIDRQGATEKIALVVQTPCLGQKITLTTRFHTLGYDAKPQIVGKGNHGTGN
jgi:hypothetical protein